MKPMLAVEHDPEKLRFPLLASPKLDGIRCLIDRGFPVSRTLKVIPSLHIQDTLGGDLFNGFDGELIVGPATAPNVFQMTTSHVMAHDKVFDFTYWVFDLWDQPNADYITRMGKLRLLLSDIEDVHRIENLNIKALPQVWVKNADELSAYEESTVAQGYEGVILRDPNGRYKFGRSTVNEGLLLKVKRFADSEAEIIGFEEQMMNCNEATKNELGRTKRSTAKDGLVGKDTLGALRVRDLKTGLEFNVGTGLDDTLRLRIWGNRDDVLGEIITYKYFPVGVKDLPRHPVFKGFRAKEDI